MDDLPKTKLYVPSKWTPDHNEISPELRSRIGQFKRESAKLFSQQPTTGNLLPSQRQALRALRSRDDLIVLKTDKNLGPAVVERKVYIQRALDEHLADTNTYRRLTQQQAERRIKAVKRILTTFTNRHFPSRDKFTIEGCTGRFLQSWLEQFTTGDIPKDPFSYFYLLAKIHKTPWKTRPIISYSGSILHGLGKWLDSQLQLICQRLPFFLASSRQLVKQLATVNPIHTSRLFTCDAVSMYTNINTEHALFEIANFVRQSPLILELELEPEPIIAATEIIMKHNVFCFGDTYWTQLSGTAMGTPPAPMYATLYFAIHEAKVIPQFPELNLYRRYIDDGLGIWTPNPKNSQILDLERWNSFQEQFNNYGTLSWEFSERTRSAIFLDITIEIDPESPDRLSHTLFQKVQNLYLYLPAHSAHPPGVVKGLVHGMYNSNVHLNSNRDDIDKYINLFLTRMEARGHSRTNLQPILDKSKEKMVNVQQPQPHTANVTQKSIFLHVKYHPASPTSRELQAQFREHMLEPTGECQLAQLKNLDNVPIGINRMVIAYHRPKNLGDLLTPRKFKTTNATSVSSFLTESDPTSENPDINTNDDMTIG